MRNPIRRSRKIGQTQGGRVKGGRAEEKRSHRFSRNVWEELSNLAGPCRVVVENPSSTYIHPCQPSEYLDLLARLPEETTAYLKVIVLRRTSKADERATIEARRRYSCVLLNSFPRSLVTRWPHPPTDAQVRHFAPWCTGWGRDERSWTQTWTLDEIRRYYLYHLLLHELGHINQPGRLNSRKRESFAEDFALEWATRLGVLPSRA